MLRATLDCFTADEILGMIGRAGTTGALRVFGPHTLGAVYCHQGSITFATTDEREDLLDVLTRAGFVRDAGTATDATSLAELLMNSHVDMQRLHDFVRHRTEESVFEMSLWEDGELQFEPDDDHPFGDAFSYPMDAVLEGTDRRRAQWSKFTERLPSADTVVAQVPALPGDDGDLTISRTQWRVLAAVDGRRSVGAITEALGTGLFATCQLLISLLDAGLVTVVDAPVVPDEPLAVATSRSAVAAGDGISYDPPLRARHLAMVGGTADEEQPDAPDAPEPPVDGGAGSGGRDAAATVADHLGLPPIEFINGGGERPSRDLILRLLSAVKEL
jgi:hypothetical protein